MIGEEVDEAEITMRKVDLKEENTLNRYNEEVEEEEDKDEDKDKDSDNNSSSHKKKEDKEQLHHQELENTNNVVKELLAIMVFSLNVQIIFS